MNVCTYVGRLNLTLWELVRYVIVQSGLPKRNWIKTLQSFDGGARKWDVMDCTTKSLCRWVGPPSVLQQSHDGSILLRASNMSPSPSRTVQLPSWYVDRQFHCTFPVQDLLATSSIWLFLGCSFCSQTLSLVYSLFSPSISGHV